jgi:hypothetical protein
MENTTTEKKKGFLQNDRLLVCSMLVFYGVCIIGLIGAAFWWLNERSQILSASATSTAVAVGTQHANATVTAIAHATEQAQFEFIDRFDDNSRHWYVGEYKNNGYWDGSMEIKEGVYAWSVEKVKNTFVQRIDFSHTSPIKDFDVYLDTKFVEGTFGDVCGGLVFRRSFKGWDNGAYIFMICNNSTFEIQFHGDQGWENILNGKYSDMIQPSEWNRIEIEARDNHFTFMINNLTVHEFIDDRQVEGALEIIMEINDKNPAVIWFDNFGYQSR